MDVERAKSFRKILIENEREVSVLEYTQDNYKDGVLIEEGVPTMTTEFCEIGFYNGEVYFVFVMNSEYFDLSLFEKLRNEKNMLIYGFVNFNKTLYPVDDFDENNFMRDVKNDRYLQIQFDYKNTELKDLIEEYLRLEKFFVKNGIEIVNQLEVDLVLRKGE